jgi:hypothetical protein
VTVAVTRRGAIVHVDVMDDGQTGLPHWREATVEDEGGRGFQLVNEIAQRWGFLRERACTCVWFELAPTAEAGRWRDSRPGEARDQGPAATR